jgi:two-component system CheB/CheR fusion protein
VLSTIRHARWILWCSDVTGVGEWTAGNVAGRRLLQWAPRVTCEAAAQAVLPLEIKPGSNYFEAWRDSRHRGDDACMRDTAYNAIVRNEGGYQQVFRCYDRCGEEHWLFEEVSISPRGSGEWHVVGVATDVTAHYQAIESVRQVGAELGEAMRCSEGSSAVLSLLLDTVPLGIALLSREGTFIRTNDAFCRLTGVSESTLTRAPVTRWVPAALANFLEERLQISLQTKTQVEEELDVGAARWDVKLTPLQLAASNAFAASLVVRDVTRERQAERLRTAKEVAEAASAAKDRFLATLSHELRMPLMPILAVASDFASREAITPECREAMRIVRANVEVEARLIDDLLDLTRISSDRLNILPEPLDAIGMLCGLADMYRPQFEQRGLELCVSLHAEAPVVSADPVRLRQVILNLLANALKFTPAGGRVTIECGNGVHGDARTLEICVRDTGIGIAAADIKRVFKPFEQAAGLDDVRRRAGLGLGLAISRSIIELHGGELTAESDGVGRGACMRLWLPGASVTLAAKEACPENCGPVRTGRILLVEDHADTAFVLRMLLQRAGHEVTVAESLRGAREALAAHEFDLVLSDLGLPDGSGLDLARDVTDHLPAIAMSGFCADADREESLRCGFSEHLGKPVSIDILHAAIQRCLAVRAVAGGSMVKGS